MKDLSVSNFKARLSSYLREVQNGETLVITEHQRPVAEVRAYGAGDEILVPASRPFTLNGTAPSQRVAVRTGTKSATQLLDEERGDR